MQRSVDSVVQDDTLLDSIKATYRVLRLGLGCAALALPIVLAVVGWLRGVPLQASMSAYYHTGMRDVFVGVLFAAGAALYLYKGFSRVEDWVLNFAGTFAIGVALFPTRADAGPITVHGTSAVLFFACLAFVAIFRAKDTLVLIKNPARVKRYTSIYNLLGAAMVAFPAIAAVLVSAYQYDLAEGKTKLVVFAVEFAAISAFAAFWFVKTQEIRRTQEEVGRTPQGKGKALY